MQRKKEKASFFMRGYTLIVFTVLLVVLVSFFSYIIGSTYQSVYSQARDMAVNYTILDSGAVDTTVAKAYDNLFKLHDGVKRNPGAPGDVLSSISQGMGYTYVRYFSDGRQYDISGADVMFEPTDDVQALIDSGESGSTGLVYDFNTNTKGIAFYTPVSDKPGITGILVFLECGDLLDTLADTDAHTTVIPAYHSVSSKEGRIIYQKANESFPTDKSTNVFDYIRKLTTSKTLLDTMRNTIEDGGSGADMITVETEQYVIAFCNFGVSDALFSISIYPAKELVDQGYNLINQLTVTTVCICILFFIILMYLVVLQRKYHRRLTEGVVVDPLLGCSTYTKFCADASALVNSNPNSKFAVIFLQIHKFKNIASSFGAEQSENIIRYLNKIISKIVTGKETWGHINEDQFVIIIHYNSVREMMDRLKVVNALLYSYELKQSGYTIKLSCGAFCSERDNHETVENMVDCASIAQKNNENNALEICTIYDERVRAKYLQEAEIESKMEQALEDGLFRAYFQPKYNIARDRLDSAESLVRWYDPEKDAMIPPGVYINLFESDGFIKKLDRYMYTTVCKFIASAVRNGDHIVPISVNVSRVTALEMDFAEFYISEKKKYRIADRFIVLEFTESFASENDAAMRQIVTKLKNNGFECSVDDFGSGYSSYNVLKEMPMDELKLDKFFIKTGVDAKKDDTLLSSMINLAKNLDMKVVQEGVETIEELDRLRQYGCDVVQGYYYAKPLDENQFIEFMNGDTSLYAVRNRNVIPNSR